MNSHIPVLREKVLDLLQVRPGNIFIDCTLGVGGHSKEILQNLEGTGAVYGIEVDERNLELAKENLKNFTNVHFVRDNFENLESIGEKILKKEKRIDGILFDLGLSSLHVDLAERGFSFRTDGPLDMRFDTRQKITAADIINTWSLNNLLFIFQTYGQEKFSQRIAHEIIKRRREQRFTTTAELADFVTSVVPKRFFHKIHPATRIFQALRIATNREIEVLETGLRSALNVLSPGGRLVVISYHSLEDRLVKNIFRDYKKADYGTLLTKKPIEPDEAEKAENKRSRSAKLRGLQKN